MTSWREGNPAYCSPEEHFAVERFLHAEASMLDAHQLRLWLNTAVHADISYQMTIRPELFGRDDDGGAVWIYDDDFAALDLRVRQFETGLQKMLDPLPRMGRAITNIEVFRGEIPGLFEVYSYGLVHRFRREYEEERLFYKRIDTLERRSSSNFKVISRLVDLPVRVFTGKNLLVIL